MAGNQAFYALHLRCFERDGIVQSQRTIDQATLDLAPFSHLRQVGGVHVSRDFRVDHFGRGQDGHFGSYDTKLNGKDFQVILGTSKGWLPFYYMGIQAVIAGMNNWAPEIMTAMLKWTFEGDRDRSEKAYTVIMDLS